ncbi:hypothetical protein M408DRAFT_321315 [Serendipita vermifera MAFF 305830]|uniref:Uncharacterized protein n=1 Tax=Serendipita vermifera MAFF 305830 TaxID=933852 RepID=A0A0C3AT51_SERVB|nr:hypothetical protein M408DRAFT_321315 [Serendipita vermifera MAFF 305830]
MPKNVIESELTEGSGSPLGNGDGGGSTAVVSLGSDNLVIMARSQIHSLTLPGVEMACDVDSSADGSSWRLLGIVY